MIELTNLHIHRKKPFLIIGTPMNSGLDVMVANIMADDFLWEDDQTFLFLCTSNETKIKLVDVIRTRAAEFALELVEGKDYLKLQNNVFYFCNYLKNQIPLPLKFDHVYVHEYSNEIELAQHFDKVAERSEKFWISTLDYEESIIYNEDFKEEDKIVIFSDQSNKNILKMLSLDRVFQDTFIREVTGEFKNI